LTSIFLLDFTSVPYTTQNYTQ